MKNANQESLNPGGFAPVSCRAATTRLLKRFLPGLLILLASFCVSAAAQTSEWTWMGGSDLAPPTGSGLARSLWRAWRARGGKFSRGPVALRILDRRRR